ncbi:MAG: hypothetical protein IPP94_09255 [Ignavibacteria bacterium]|nr:hypothetical protein [Ignavibacteria bacterium]
MNPLLAVFWDYPAFAEEDALRALLSEGKDTERWHWVLMRFLERARVADTFTYFTRSDIATGVRQLPEQSPERIKWERLLVVYG